MEAQAFQQYLKDFEQQVVIGGVQAKTFKKTFMVSVKSGKLDSTEFGKTIGTKFEHAGVIVIDYYGLLKRSTGFWDKIKGMVDVEVKSLKSVVVHFASIKIEHVTDLAPDLVVGFSDFKKHLVESRAFENNE